jgi:hypothetical protein
MELNSLISIGFWRSQNPASAPPGASAYADSGIAVLLVVISSG